MVNGIGIAMCVQKGHEALFLNVVGEDFDDHAKDFHLGWMENDL
jgi:hypothetical protein